MSKNDNMLECDVEDPALMRNKENYARDLDVCRANDGGVTARSEILTRYFRVYRNYFIDPFHLLYQVNFFFLRFKVT